MAYSNTDRFVVSGPTHMMSRAGDGSFRMMIDWDNEEHRRCIAACVIQGIRVMEKDKTRRGWELAPAWWKSFHLHLTDELKDDRSIFGAIYKHVLPAGRPRQPSAPDYIVAFRGTMQIEDMDLNKRIMTNTVKDSNRAQSARQAVDNLLDSISSRCVVWLTGHSQGGSLALEVGRAMMVDRERNLPTFLFNTPQVSLSPVIDKMHPTEAVKTAVYGASYILKASLGLVLSPHRKNMEELFERLSPWAPNLYVHGKDFICQGFIDYFEQRQQLEERFGGVAKSAMALSYRDMFRSVRGKRTEQPHLLPSATLWKNSSLDSNAPGIKQLQEAHGLQQWWKPDRDLRLSAKRYSYL